MRFFLLLGGLFLAGSAWAQQPALPGAPQPPAVPAAVPAPTPAPETPGPTTDFVLGSRYEITLKSGTSFTGTLTTISLDALEFDAPDLGHLRVLRTEVQQARSLDTAKLVGLRPGYYDIGNGNRLFFAPTARGLRKGEGSLQDVNIYIIGANYGITDYISLGGYITLIPGAGLTNQFLVLTPKVSFPVRKNLHVGAGVLYVRIPDFDGALDRSYGAGIFYGAATYGSADNNVTVGLGYGFFEGNIGSTPIVQVGGQKRISRRISLISENYIIADSHAGLGGLYGIKINWRRTSLGLGAAYVYAFGYDETYTTTYYNNNGTPYTTTQTTHQGGGGGSTYILPVYYDFTYRFGKGAK
jgi:hypothetical protein